MYHIKVVNFRKHKATSNDFYCGRGRGSVLGNKYTHIQDKETQANYIVKTREESIQKHKEDFIKEIEIEGKIKEAFFNIYDHIRKYKQANLICWCAPKSCHCDTIKEELIKRLPTTHE